MCKAKLLALLLLTAFAFDLGAAPDAEERKAAREARKQERKEKREAKKSKDDEVNLQDVVVEQVSAQNVVVPEETSVEEEVAFVGTETIEPAYEEVSEEVYIEEDKSVPLNADNKSQSEEQPGEGTQEGGEDNSWALILIIVVVIVVAFFRWLNSRRCRRCGRRFAMVDIHENFHGFGRENGKGHNNIKVTRECKYCGFQDYVVEKRPFDK